MENKQNLLTGCWSLIMRLFAKSAVILNHAAVSGSLKDTVG